MTRLPGPALLLSLAAFLISCSSAPTHREAQNLGAKPFDQLVLAGNACGPAALLNSYRFGNPEWRKLAETPHRLTDRERIRSITSGPAMRESASLPGRARWSRNGVNISDLRDIADEIASPHGLPALQQQTLFLKPGESQETFLRRVHAQLERSLANGFPPIVSIRRFAKRRSQWTAVQGHFVTVTSLPSRLPNGADSFDLRYIDPLGGKFQEGAITILAEPFLVSDPAANPNLTADFPELTIGRKSVQRGERSVLAISAALGDF